MFLERKFSVLIIDFYPFLFSKDYPVARSYELIATDKFHCTVELLFNGQLWWEMVKYLFFKSPNKRNDNFWEHKLKHREFSKF